MDLDEGAMEETVLVYDLVDGVLVRYPRNETLNIFLNLKAIRQKKLRKMIEVM